MPDGFSGAFSIQVQGADNPTLGQNGQALCRIRLRFEHAYIGDLRITLTAPGGQTVTLIGPVGFFNPTNFSEWNVNFVPCNKTANPDLGFAPTWSNAQGWGTFGNYTGSYHPITGCLEDFNGGPVNGEWTLKVEDLQTGDTGTFLGYELVFCDPSGIECTNCAANAGFLLHSDLTTCAGDSALNLSLPPVYFDPQKRPPPTGYDYKYVISGPGNVILDYSPKADLRNYPPGVYSVCGLSYYKQHLPLLPSPNGVLTYNELALRLNATTPPLCGQVTNRCVGISIKPPPRDTLLETTVCAPDCVLFFGQSYCNPGVYTQALKDAVGCSFTATLKLNVRQPSSQMLFDTVCAGACSAVPGFEKCCLTGTYVDTLQNVSGCDSVVTLQLWVKSTSLSPPVFVAVDTSICLGDTLHLRINAVPDAEFYHWSAGLPSAGAVVVGDTALTLPWVTPTGATVCVKAANTCAESAPVCLGFSTRHLPLAAVVLGADTVCNAAISYFRVDSLAEWRDCHWQVEGGAVVGQKGAFEIAVNWNKSIKPARICATLFNKCGAGPPGCRLVTVDSIPASPLLQGDTLICAGSESLLVYAVAPALQQVDYQWGITGAGQIDATSGAAEARVRWSPPGGMLCATASNHCGVSMANCLSIKAFEVPLAQAGPDADTCGQSLSLSAAASIGLGEWLMSDGPAGSHPTFQMDKTAAQNALQVDLPGLYRATWTVTNGVCVASDTVALRFYAVPAVTAYTFACDTFFENYQVRLSLSGGTPPYAFDGKSINGGTFVSPILANHTPFQFQFTDANGCATKPVADVYACPCFSNAGQMSETPLVVCGSDSIVVQKPQGALLDANDTGFYLLHTAASDTVGLVLAKNKTGVFRFQTGMAYEQTYYISYVVGNTLNGAPDLKHPCLSVAKGQPIRFYQQPEAMAGLDTSTCGLSGQLQAVATNGVGSWSLLGGPLGSQLLFVKGSDNPQNECEVDQYGTYRLGWRVTNGACTTTDTLNFHFFQPPQAATPIVECDSVAEHYRLFFPVLGGTSPFAVNGVVLAGASFTSDWIEKDKPYTYVVSDANQCVAPILSGVQTCACLTDAGKMDTALLSVCAGTSVLAHPPEGARLDPNDTALFVLHTSATKILGTVLAKSRDGRFEWQPGMAYDTTYYISYIAGNTLQGEPDPLHPCFSVAKGQPLVFSQKPQGSAGIDRDTCGLSVAVTASLDKGLGVWTSLDNALTFRAGNQTADNIAIAPQAGEYQAIWEVVNGACSSRDTARLRFFPELQTGSFEVMCDSISEHFRVSFEISGGQAPFWVNGTSSNGPNFVSPPMASGSAYAFHTVDANGCRAAGWSGSHQCPCLSKTGRMPLEPLYVCEGDSAKAQLLEQAQLDPNDTGVFVLHTSAADTLGEVLDYNEQGIFVFRPGWLYQHTYYIAYFAGNTLNGIPDWQHPCAQLSKGQPLVFFQKPRALAGVDRDTCGQSIVLRPEAAFGTGAWSVLAKPSGGDLFFAPIGANSAITATVPGDYRAVWTVSNTACTVRDTVGLHFFSIPSLGNPRFFCDNVNEQYTVVGEVNGGTSPYWVNGAPMQDNHFTSGLLGSGTPYFFQLTDVNGCQASPLTGTYTCACSSHAGTMDPVGLQVCEEDTIQVKVPPDMVLDANDTGRFVLHTASGFTLGTIWAQNTNGRFTFQPGMSHDSLYYLSYVVGNARNGIPDWEDVCLSVSKGQPLQFLPPPMATLHLQGVRCYGETNGVITALAQKGSAPVLYALNEQPFSEQAVFKNLAPGLYHIRTLDATGCEWGSDSLVLEAPPKLEVALEKQLTLNQGDTLLVALKISPPSAVMDTVLWHPLLDTLAAGLPWQRISPLRSLMLSVSVRDTNGCQAQEQTLVRVQKNRHVFVPNAVTLQAGENTNLTVFGGAEVQEIDCFELFDRWGNLWYKRLHFPPGSPDSGWQKKMQQKKAVPRMLIYRATVVWKDGTKDIFYGDIFLMN